MIAIAVCAAIYAVNLDEPQAKVGPIIFIGVSILAFVYALFAGRTFTADCLSSEKRDGTLGLLFLTDLKGYDVVLGKLAATSLNGFLGFLALLPVMAIPLMMGGTTAGQFWHMVLVLLSTFFFSLALGIFTSSFCRDQRRATGMCVGILLLLTLAFPGAVLLCAGLAGASEPPLIACYESPLFAFLLAFEDLRRAAPRSLIPDFYTSVVVINGLGVLFVIMAGRIVPRSWQDRPVTRPVLAREPATAGTAPRRHPRAEYRRRLLSVNAFYWLAARNPFKPLQVWIFMMAMAAWWIWSKLSTGSWFEMPIPIVLTFLVNTTLKLWVTIEAGQRLADDQRAGALELLLSTPLTARDILHGQFLALRRQFLRPVVLVLGLEMLFFLVSFRKLYDGGPGARWFFVVGAILLLADAIAGSWVAMQLALTSRNPQRAAAATFLRIFVLPWVLFGLIVIGAGVVAFIMDVRLPNTETAAELAQFGLWLGTGLACDLFFGLRARQQLLGNLRMLATESRQRKQILAAA